MLKKFQIIKSRQAVMNWCLVVAVCLSALGPQSAHAAVCTAENNNACVATDYTLASCNADTKICDCKPNNFPIPTGCASKLATPTASYAAGRTGLFIPGASVKLTCITYEVGNIVYDWKKGTTSIATNVKTPEYELTGVDAGKVGNFSCQVKDADLSLISDSSNAIEMNLATNTTTLNLAVIGVPANAAYQTVYTIGCTGLTGTGLTGLPYGTTFNLTAGGAPVADNKMTFTATSAPVTCNLVDVPGIFFNKTSPALAWPTGETTAVASVLISPTNAVAQTYYIGAQVIITCQSSPPASNLDITGKTVAYAFVDSANPTLTANGNQYTVMPTTAGVHNISCSATYNGNTVQSTNNVVITFSNNTFVTPVLNTTATTVQPGSRLVLTCGNALTGVSYSWKKGGNPIFYQKDRIIQIGNFASADAGEYVCQANQDNYQVSSNKVSITSSAQRLYAVVSTILLVLVAEVTAKIF